MEWLRPDSVLVWDSKEISERLRWYKGVMEGEFPPKYVIAKALSSEISLEAPLEELLEEHKSLSEEFSEVRREIVEGGKVKLEDKAPSFLDLKVEIARRISRSCELCERKCKVNRERGERGICLVPSSLAYVDTYFLHMGEEAPLVPSGTIFYEGCNFKCVYCQNWSISQEPKFFKAYDAKKLAKIQEKLKKSGARNINHVGGDPTPHLVTILESMKYLKVKVPQLWNSNMYLSELSMSLLLEVIDIWLPDFKYGSGECARRLSKVDRYFEVVTRNLEMLKGEDVIVRHLVLPGHLNCCTFEVIKWLSENLKGSILNLMDQYRPEYLAWRDPKEYSEISRRPSSEELEEAYEIALKCGWEGPVFDLWYHK